MDAIRVGFRKFSHSGNGDCFGVCVHRAVDGNQEHCAGHHVFDLRCHYHRVGCRHHGYEGLAVGSQRVHLSRHPHWIQCRLRHPLECRLHALFLPVKTREDTAGLPRDGHLNPQWLHHYLWIRSFLVRRPDHHVLKVCSLDYWDDLNIVLYINAVLRSSVSHIRTIGWLWRLL